MAKQVTPPVHLSTSTVSRTVAVPFYKTTTLSDLSTASFSIDASKAGDNAWNPAPYDTDEFETEEPPIFVKKDLE